MIEKLKRRVAAVASGVVALYGFVVGLPAPARRRLYKAAIAVGLVISAKVGIDAHTFMQWAEFAVVVLSTVGAPTLAHQKVHRD